MLQEVWDYHKPGSIPIHQLHSDVGGTRTVLNRGGRCSGEPYVAGDGTFQADRDQGLGRDNTPHHGRFCAQALPGGGAMCWLSVGMDFLFSHETENLYTIILPPIGPNIKNLCRGAATAHTCFPALL